MPPAIRTPDIFMIPSSPNISWATVMIATLIILDVSTEIGEYHDAINNRLQLQSTKWENVGSSKVGSSSKEEVDDAAKVRQRRRHQQRRLCKMINIAALQAGSVGMVLIVLSALVVTHLTQGMDGRMTLVLEGVSRLEAAHLMAYISVKTPRWIGVYHSSQKDRCIQHVGSVGSEVVSDIHALKFHVRYSIGQYFALVYCLMLPFAGRPLSALLGFALGFAIEFLLSFARRSSSSGDGERRFRVAFGVAFAFAFASSIMFADGCHYIQVVWGSGLYFSEWGLGIATFSSSFAVVLCQHAFHLQRTVRRLLSNSSSADRRMSTHEEREKMAVSLIRSHLFGSSTKLLSGSLREELEREMEGTQIMAGDEGTKITEDATTSIMPTTWSLFKKRLFAPTDLVVFSKVEYCTGVLISVASLFVVIVNIGATKQMNVVRRHFHTVHDTLYGHMDRGPVCAFDEIGGGTVATFDDATTARSKGYKVAHCGACGQCSTWQDLRLQYTTRNYLAKESARCAKKSLVYGRDAVHTCLGEEPIGFSDQCAECWTEDIFCARSHCAFIFLQSNMINTVSNFQVGDDTITAATCEEAMCELAFVPCSGANRRRMNITSTIARPGRQLCGIVDVDWDDVFGEDGSYKSTLPRGEDKNDEL